MSSGLYMHIHTHTCAPVCTRATTLSHTQVCEKIKFLLSLQLLWVHYKSSASWVFRHLSGTVAWWCTHNLFSSLQVCFWVHLCPQRRHHVLHSFFPCSASPLLPFKVRKPASQELGGWSAVDGFLASLRLWTPSTRRRLMKELSLWDYWPPIVHILRVAPWRAGLSTSTYWSMLLWKTGSHINSSGVC